jgi:hypothetical protein
LESVLIPEGVTLIQPLAFYKCSSLASLEIPETVEEIGGSAFSGCSELATINLPESLTIINQGVFRGCSKLLSIVIPSGVTQIGAEAFAGSAVEGMILPDALITIGDNAFHSTRLVNLSIPSSVTSIGAEAFKNCHALLGVEFLNQAFSLGSGAFIQCSNLRGLYFSGPPPTLGGNGGIGLPTRIIVSEEHADAFGGFGAIWNGLPVEAGDEKSIFFKYQEFPASITITDYLETIGGEIVVPNEIYGKPVTAIHTSAFEDCSGLTSILLPDGLESIELYAFRNCVSLQEIQISQGVVEIGSRAFESCHSLETVNIPASVSSLGSLPFYDCINLVEINVDEGNEVYESSAGLLLAEEGTRVIGFAAGLESAIIPDGVIVIMPNAFAGATKLANVSFPQSVVAINGSAFYNCIGLIEITIPENVTVLAEGVFREASNLQTIYFEGPAPVNMQDKDIGVSATAVVSPEHAQSYGGEGASWFGLTVSVGDDQVENFLGLTLTFSEDGIILSASGLSQGLDYLIETSSNLQEWSLIHSFTSNFSSQDIEVAQPSGASNYYRVRRVIE